MNAGGASPSGSGPAPAQWSRNKPAAKRTLRSSRSALLQILRDAAREQIDGERARHARSEVYWHLSLLSKELQPTSDSVQVRLPRTSEELDAVRRAMTPLFVDVVALFGHAPNIMELVDDDERGTNTDQIRQLMQLKVRLQTAIEGYQDLVEEKVRSDSRRTAIRSELIDAFSDFQNKIELIVEGLEEWRG